MRSVVLVHVDTGDWMGVYDASSKELIYQGHDIEPERLLEIVGVTHTRVTSQPIGRETHLPRKLDELDGWGGSWGKVDPRERLRVAVVAYKAKMAQYDAKPDGLRMGLGAVRQEVIDAASEVANEAD